MLALDKMDVGHALMSKVRTRNLKMSVTSITSVIIGFSILGVILFDMFNGVSSSLHSMRYR